MPLERFVIDLLKRGYEPQWCDAAFRAFSTGGLMNKYEYTIAGNRNFQPLNQSIHSHLSTQ